MGVRLAIAGVLTACLVAILLPASAVAATECTFSAATHTLTVDGDPDVGTVVEVNGDAITVRHLRAGGSNLIDCSGVNATTANTDTVAIDHSSPDEVTSVSISDPEAFAPGFTDETLCPDEIEIELDLAIGPDLVSIFDGGTEPLSSNLEIGGDGVDWNPSAVLCSDADIFPAEGSNGALRYRVFSASGDDRVSALGGEAAGDPLGTSIEVNGGEGDDVLLGGRNADVMLGDDGRDVILGGEENDLLTGGLGKDELFGELGIDGLFAEDGAKDRELDCGPGAKIGEFAVIDRRKDPRPKSC